jgi:hypothetical protein
VTPIDELLEVDSLARIAHEAFRAWFVATYPNSPRRAAYDWPYDQAEDWTKNAYRAAARAVRDAVLAGKKTP